MRRAQLNNKWRHSSKGSMCVAKQRWVVNSPTLARCRHVHPLMLLPPPPLLLLLPRFARCRLRSRSPPLQARSIQPRLLRWFHHTLATRAPPTWLHTGREHTGVGAWQKGVEEPAAAGDWVIAQVGCLRCSTSRRLGNCSGRLSKRCKLHRKCGCLRMAASAASYLGSGCCRVGLCRTAPAPWVDGC